MLWALLPALAAFAWSASPRPDWLSGETPDYPKARYILGHGEALSQDKAADKARADVAKAFGVALTVKTESSQREIGDAQGSAYSQTVSDEVTTSASRVLDGVEVVRYWRDDEGVHHALAVLERARTLRIVADKLAELDAEFASSAAELARSQGKFARLRWALKLLASAKTRRRLNENHRILSPDGKGLPAPDGWSRTLAEAAKAVRDVTVAVEAAGEESGRVASRVSDALSARGLRAVQGSEGADVVLRLRCEGRPMRPENITWFWARGTIAATMSYGATGETFKSFTETGQEASRDPGSSVAAALTALADRAAARAYETLTSSAALDD